MWLKEVPLVVITVFKKGQFRELLMWLKRCSFGWLLVWLRRGSFGWLFSLCG